jgi:hypothetical protein
VNQDQLVDTESDLDFLTHSAMGAHTPSLRSFCNDSTGFNCRAPSLALSLVYAQGR